jgi:hypothetical protein
VIRSLCDLGAWNTPKRVEEDFRSDFELASVFADDDRAGTSQQQSSLARRARPCSL